MNFQNYDIPNSGAAFKILKFFYKNFHNSFKQTGTLCLRDFLKILSPTSLLFAEIFRR